MVATCPDGHTSQAGDYCDVCGTAITAVGAADPTVVTAACPACGAVAAGRFCEVCGYDSALPPPVTPPEVGDSGHRIAAPPPDGDPEYPLWIATVTADHDFYLRVQARNGPDAERVEFPDFYPERRIGLTGGDVLIGKRSVSQGVLPDIDLGIAPVDIGVSRSHARLRIVAGAVTVTDLGSTNGTSLNDSDELIPPRTPVRLHVGDRIHVGGWTTILLSTESSTESSDTGR